MLELNLDAMTRQELWDLWKRIHDHPIIVARELFPAVPRPVGYVSATETLGAYACNKSVAMNEREQGRIETALTYKRICDCLYDQLPPFARW